MNASKVGFPEPLNSVILGGCGLLLATGKQSASALLGREAPHIIADSGE
jgi:hypothetical protein